ncbi:MAG: hypothetical protein H6584_08485 [Flavobacteriales bacterium]|nr:hypothetical protein [Flavobacteriales bacterium]
MELSLKESMDWNGTSLSEKPVVVFDGQSRPKYYEFIVTNDSEEAIGTVTACAQKETDAALSHVLPYVRDYTNLTTKGGSYKMISGGYPTKILIGIPGKSGEEPVAVIDPATGETVTEIISEDAQGMIDAITALTDEEKEQLGLDDTSALINEISQKDLQNQEYAEQYWSIVDSLQVELEAMSDDEIITAINESKGSWVSYDQYVIPAYNTTGMRNTRWNGWCGPSALAWVYRGLYSRYNGTYLPLAGESSFYKLNYREVDNLSKGFYDFNDKGDHDHDQRQNDLDPDWVNPQSSQADGGLYAKLAQNSGMYAWPWLTGDQNGPTFPNGLSVALSSVTDAKYKVSTAHFNLLSVQPLGHQHIRHLKLPVICMIDGFSHYVVAFGSKYQYWNWDVIVKIFGKRISIASGSIRTNKWLLMQDNGKTTSQHGYEPYWKNDNLKFDIQYGILRLY